MNNMMMAVNGNRSFFVNSADLEATAEKILQTDWDHIADFFCSTKVTEAQQHLQDFLDTSKSDNERAKSFTALRDIASPTYSAYFTISVPQEPGVEGVSFKISGIEPFVTKDLQRVNLEGVNLENANLENANLQETNLQGANLTNARMHYVNLTGTNLTDAVLANVIASYVMINRQRILAVTKNSPLHNAFHLRTRSRT